MTDHNRKKIESVIRVVKSGRGLQLRSLREANGVLFFNPWFSTTITMEEIDQLSAGAIAGLICRRYLESRNVPPDDQS